MEDEYEGGHERGNDRPCERGQKHGHGHEHENEHTREFERPTLAVETDPVADARHQSLPDSLSSLIETYEDVVADRERESWRWLYRVFPEFRLSCVDDDRARQVRAAKLLSTTFVTVADDVAERHGDRATFDELASVPFDHQHADPAHPDADGDIVQFGIDVWERFRELYDESPRANEFADLLAFDVRQVLDAIEYSYLANQSPELVSEQELWTYDAYNMMVFVHADADLANASGFDAGELSVLRQVLDRTQRMARIGNWIATWKRELVEGDYSSGVVVRALETDVVSNTTLQDLRPNAASEPIESVVQQIENSTVEAYFLDRWHVEYADAARFEEQFESVDLETYLDGFETILRSHIAKRNGA